MTTGVKIQEIEIGTGAVAKRHHTVVANLRIFLNRGEELRSMNDPDYPRQVIGWRYATFHHVSFHPDREAIDALINEALGIPVESPDECVAPHQMWVDSAEPGNGISRDLATNTRCISIGIQERTEWLCFYSLKHDSSAWTNSRLCRVISEWLGPHLAGD